MSPDKLEALRKLAADERTPTEEARNAALAFVRHGGSISVRAPTTDEIRQSVSVDRLREIFGADLKRVEDEVRKTKAHCQDLETQRDKARKQAESLESERDALKKQLDDIRAHGKALLSFIYGDTSPNTKPQKEPFDAVWTNASFPYIPRAF